MSIRTEKGLTSKAQRAGVTIFGGSLVLRSTRIDCAGFDLDVERAYASRPDGSQLFHAIETDDMNVCGCGAVAKICKAERNSLAALR